LCDISVYQPFIKSYFPCFYGYFPLMAACFVNEPQPRGNNLSVISNFEPTENGKVESTEISKAEPTENGKVKLTFSR
jgi:hypothetical protein